MGNRTSQLFDRAEQLAAQEDWPAARDAYLAVLAIDPGHGAALLQLSYLESIVGHYRLARDYALRARRAEITSPELLKDLVRRLRTFNEVEALRGCARRFGALRELGVPLLIDLGAQFSSLNEQEEALRFLDAARALAPSHPGALLARGHVLTFLGRLDEAESDLTACIALAPRIAQAHWLLSRIRRQTSSSNHVHRLRTLVSAGGSRPEDIAYLGYALHKELDDLGEHDEAWRALELACRAKRSRLDYRRQDSVDLVSSLIELPVAASAGVAPTVDGSRVPIFIVGMHRSGTTLLEQLLDGHPDVRGIGELYDFTSQMRYATDHHCRGVIDASIIARARDVDFPAVGAGYLKGIDWRLGEERCFTDKLPSNFLNLGFICQALPQSRILHMVRDPVETCFSNLRELFSDANPYSYDQIELADYYRQYQRLMAHWHRVLPGRILDVDYAELTRDPEAVLRRVTTFCGLEFDPEMLQLQRRTRSVSTASAVQVRGQVIAREKPKWTPYAHHLAPMIRALTASG